MTDRLPEGLPLVYRSVVEDVSGELYCSGWHSSREDAEEHLTQALHDHELHIVTWEIQEGAVLVGFPSIHNRLFG